jgi:hypothetical protein
LYLFVILFLVPNVSLVYSLMPLLLSLTFIYKHEFLTIGTLSGLWYL